MASAIAPPQGFVRTDVPIGSFSRWLREARLLESGAPVLLFDGKPKARQDLHAAVLDIDVGDRDLQQCADAVIRLRAEYLFATAQYTQIAFNETGLGKPMRWTDWARGLRPRPLGRGLTWEMRGRPDHSYKSFRSYLNTVFAWAGTYSLEREMLPRQARAVISGDVIIRGGFPGHAVIVMDVVRSIMSDERLVLLAQSYMPAQNIHILRNLSSPDLSPWYRIDDVSSVVTPEWTFPAQSLKRWPDSDRGA